MTTDDQADSDADLNSRTGIDADTLTTVKSKHSEFGSASWGETSWQDHVLEELGFTPGATLTVELTNIGGISHKKIELSPGVSLLVGENATNRTSILEGIGAALGGETASLKAGAETGAAHLSTETTTFTTEFTRTDSTINRSHKGPWADDDQCIAAVTNFVVLNEINPIRQTVRAGADPRTLYELIMAPVDTDAVEAAISNVQSERTRINRRIEKLETKQQRLPELEERRNDIEIDIDRLESKIEEVQTEIDNYELDRQEAEQHTQQMDDYEALLEKKEQLERDLETQREIRETAKHQLAEKEDELEAFSIDEISDYEDIEALETAIGDLRKEKDTAQRMADKVRTLVRTTQDMLAAEASLLNEFDNSNEITADLDPKSKQLTCWTCGSVVKRQTIKDRVEELKKLSQEKQREVQRIEDTQNELRQQRKEYRAQQNEREALESDIADLEREIESATTDINRIKEQLESITEEIDTLEQELEANDTTNEIDALLDAYQRRGSLQNELENKHDELSEIESEIEAIETDVAALNDLRDQRDQLDQDLKELRETVDRIELTVENEFNDRMEEILELVGYDENIARVWIERKVEDDETLLDLHIVRETPNGTVQEDTVHHLSESEREVVGLVIAVAGYVAHDIDELVPIIILDSLEAIGAGRLDMLVNKLYEITESTHLAAALLEEDAANLPDSHNYIYPANQPAEHLGD